MARWEPGAPQRLARAALELFASQGFEQTTALQIAQSVGLTERTFYRHFSDKREVLFAGQAALADAFLAGVAAAPPGAEPMRIVASALESAARYFPDDRRSFARLRHTVIDQNPALLEREVTKLANLSTTIGDALRARGIEDLPATLAAQSCVAVFGTAFAHWIREGEQRSLADLMTTVLRELVTITRT